MNTFDLNLSAVIAHTLVYESRLARWPFAGGDEPRNGGDPAAPTSTESTAEVLKALQANMPGLMNTLASNVLPYEKTLLDAQGQLSPIANQQALDNYAKFAPQFTDVGTAINRQQALGQAQSDLDVLTGPGKQLTAAALEAQKQADPEYYKSRQLALDQLSKLTSSLDDPNGGLSGSEQAEVARSLARDNIAGGNTAPSNLGVVSNAMQFGAAGAARKAQKQNAISNAIAATSGAMPAMKSGVDVMQMTLGRPSINGAMTNMVTPGQTAQAGQAAAGNVMNMTSGFQTQANQINSQRRDTLDRASQVMSSMPNVGCCWIFAEAYNGDIPWYVRSCRDLHYTPEIRAGYKRMSNWLVPAMRSSALVRELVNRFLIFPLTQYAGWMYGVNETGYCWSAYKTFWLWFWAKTGKVQDRLWVSYSNRDAIGVAK